MRIEFDSANPSELNAVFVAILVLRGGDISLPDLFGESEETRGADSVAPPAPVAAIAESLPPPAIDTAALAVHRPPAPPVPAAPPAATAPPAPAAGVEVDADGLPWDNRIHSTPPSQKKDGKWRGKRGLDDATRVAVTAELKQVMAAAPAAPTAAVPPPMFDESAPGVPLPPSEPPVDAATAFGAAGVAPAPSVPPAPPVTAPPAPAAAAPVAPPAVAPAPPAPPVETAPVSDFAALMRKITGLQSAGALTVEGTTQIASSLGITGVRDLMHRPDLIPSFDALLPVVG